MACAVATGAAAVVLGQGGTNGLVDECVSLLSSNTRPIIPKAAIVYGLISPHDALGIR
jgi:hypothetical protein